MSMFNRGSVSSGSRQKICTTNAHHCYRVTVSMDEYVRENKLRPIEVPKRYLTSTTEVSDGMLANINCPGWLASTGRPDMAAPHSIIPSGIHRNRLNRFQKSMRQ